MAMEKVKFIKDIEAPNMTITGNLTVKGTSVVSSQETVVTKESIIKLREGATAGLMSDEYTGIVAEKYDGTNNGMLVFDSEGTAYVGDEGDVQPLATRQLTTDNTVAKWDNDKKTLVDTKIKSLDNHSIILGEGNATGSYAISGGTTDSSLLQNMGVPSGITLPASQAKGTMSLAFGVEANAESVVSISMGYATIAGAKGYYYREINFTNKTIELSTKRTSLSAPSSIDWEVGDKLSIVCSNNYPYSCEITKIDGTVITVDSLPFTEDDYHNAYYKQVLGRWVENSSSYTSPEARTILNINKPTSGTVELGFGAIAIGYQNKASGVFSQSFGYNNISVGNYAFSSGFNTKAIGNQSHAEGSNTVASGYTAHSEGYLSEAIGDQSHAEGYHTIASGSNSHTEGRETEASGISSHAEGYLSKATGEFAHAEGRQTQADGNHAHAEGRETIASGYHAHAEGYLSKATNTASHAEGYGTTASGHTSHAEGYETTASGKHAHAEGEKNTASGINSHTEGFNTTAVGAESHAGGRKTSAIGVQSHTEGVSTTTYDEFLTLLGDKELNTENIVSIWETNKFLMAFGKYSHAEGENTLALHSASHAEGNSTKAPGKEAHAEGRLTDASGFQSHAEGHKTTSSGQHSHSEGNGTIASGAQSHAGGIHTIASAIAQTAIGKYNVENMDALFIIGNGNSDTERSNAFEVISTSSGVSLKLGNTVITEAQLQQLLSVLTNDLAEGEY